MLVFHCYFFIVAFIVKIMSGSNTYFYCVCEVTVCDTIRTGRGDGTVDVRDRLNDWVRIL